MIWLVIRVAASLAIAYFLGAVPFALIVGKRFYGVDLRTEGSGNLGATNVLRTLGIRAAIATAVPDVLKGSVAVLLAGFIVPASAGGMAAHEWTQVAAMLAAVAGHSYSPYIRLRGGKGVATSAGGLAVITPVAFLIEVFLFVGVVWAWRMVSLGSLLVAATYPFLVLWLYPGDIPKMVTITALALLVVWRHRSNIGRILRGEERKLSVGRRGSNTPADPKE